MSLVTKVCPVKNIFNLMSSNVRIYWSFPLNLKIPLTYLQQTIYTICLAWSSHRPTGLGDILGPLSLTQSSLNCFQNSLYLTLPIICYFIYSEALVSSSYRDFLLFLICALKSFFFFFFNICLFLAVLGLCFCAGFSLVAVHRLLMVRL